MNKEEYFISSLKSEYIGDDGACIDGYVYSKDLFCEDVHFKLSWMSLYDIAIKAMLVNISDAIVMNAKVKYALIGIKIPSSFTKVQISELSRGFNDTASQYDFEIIGGDTVSGDKLDISITLISTTSHATQRSGVKEGDLIAYTGDLGSVKKDLDLLLHDQPISKNSKFIRPILRDKFMYQASKYINSALDISDGLSKDLSRLSQINSIGFEFDREFLDDILCSAEEYEILFAFDAKYLKDIQKISNDTNTPINIFAKAIQGSYENRCQEHHFKFKS